MKNIEILNEYVKKNGSESILVHTIPNTSLWLVCQKIEKDKWQLNLINPMGTATYNLGTCNSAQYMYLWEKLMRTEIESQIKQAVLIRELKRKINQFLKQYNKFIKRNKTK